MSTVNICDTKLGQSVLYNYLTTLVNRLFKVLPLREEADETCDAYISGLIAELLGFSGLIKSVKCDASYIAILSTLQYLLDNPNIPVKAVKKAVFDSISLCYALRKEYCKKVVDDSECLGQVQG